MLRSRAENKFLVLVTVGLGHGVYRKMYTFTGGQRAEKCENHCHRHTGSGVHRKFSWGGLVQDHMVVICIWCALFVTSQFDVMSMFPNQRFGEVC